VLGFTLLATFTAKFITWTGSKVEKSKTQVGWPAATPLSMPLSELDDLWFRERAAPSRHIAETHVQCVKSHWIYNSAGRKTIDIWRSETFLPNFDSLEKLLLHTVYIC
jgi:hypothetical protein